MAAPPPHSMNLLNPALSNDPRALHPKMKPPPLKNKTPFWETIPWKKISRTSIDVSLFYHLAVSRPTLGHYHRDSLTHPILISNPFINFWLEGHRESPLLGASHTPLAYWLKPSPPKFKGPPMFSTPTINTGICELLVDTGNSRINDA